VKVPLRPTQRYAPNRPLSAEIFAERLERSFNYGPPLAQERRMLRLDKFERYPLTFGPTPIEHLPRMTAALGGKVQIYAKRDDGGGAAR